MDDAVHELFTLDNDESEDDDIEIGLIRVYVTLLLSPPSLALLFRELVTGK